MKDNRGFSLIELLIGLAVLGIVLSMVSAIMVIGSKQYTEGISNAEMQKEARVVVGQIESMLADTNGGVDYTEETVAGKKVHKLKFFNTVNNEGAATYTKEIIAWYEADGTVTYSMWNLVYNEAEGKYMETDTSEDAEEEDAADAVYFNQLMAENITNFAVDISDTVQDKDKDKNTINILRSVSISLTCKSKNSSSTYTTNPVITLRNRMMLSGNVTQAINNAPPVDDTLSVYIAESGTSNRLPIQGGITTLQKGSIYYLYAIRGNKYDVNDLVNWKISEGNTLSTIDNDTGEIFINSMEPNSILTLVAYYKDNPTKYAETSVRINTEKSIRNVEIVRVPSGSSGIKYVSHIELDGFTAADEANITYQWDVSNPELVQGVNTTSKDLTLTVPASAEGKSYTVKLTVSAENCNSKSAQINGVVSGASNGGDSCVIRGGGEKTYEFSLKGSDYNSEIYFCDEFGKRKTIYDAYISQYVVFKDLGAGKFSLEIKDGLPGNVTYYLKYVAVSALGTYERIFEIPAVQILGMDTKANWHSMESSLTYTGPKFVVYGRGGSFDPNQYEAEVQYIEYDRIEGVSVSAKMDNLSLVSGVVTGDLIFSVTGENVDLSKVKVHSVKVKLRLKDTEVFAYSTLTFTE